MGFYRAPWAILGALIANVSYVVITSDHWKFFLHLYLDLYVIVAVIDSFDSIWVTVVRNTTDVWIGVATLENDVCDLFTYFVGAALHDNALMAGILVSNISVDISVNVNINVSVTN